MSVFRECIHYRSMLLQGKGLVHSFFYLFFSRIRVFHDVTCNQMRLRAHWLTLAIHSSTQDNCAIQETSMDDVITVDLVDVDHAQCL